MAHPLESAFELINQSDYVQVAFNGHDQAALSSLSQLIESDWLEQMLAKQKDGWSNLDRRGEASFLIGRFTFVTAIVLAGCQIKTGRIPMLSPDSLSVSMVDDRIEFHLSDDTTLAWSEQTDIRAMIIELFRPMVAQLAMKTKLAPAKQWSLISDSLAMTWQFVAEPLGLGAKARHDIMQLLNGDKSVLKNRRTGFEEYKLFKEASDQAPTIHKYIRTRAGCCRKFTDDGDYCNTCVYLPETERRERIRKTLWQNYFANL